MTLRTAAQLTEFAIPASVRDIENWVARLDLKTAIDKPAPGRPRMFSRINALELGMIAAMVRGGASPSKAAVVAANFVSYASRGWRHSVYRKWLIFPAGDFTQGVHTDLADPQSKLISDLNSTTLSMINVQKLRADIDKLYGVDA